TGNVLTGAADGEGDSLTATAGTSAATAHGSVTILSDGSYTYTPDAGYFGSDSFTFTANSSDKSNDRTVTIKVTHGNDPTVVPPTVTTNEGVGLTGNVLTGAADGEGDSLTATAGTFPTAQGGSVTIASDGTYTYTPAAGFDGSDSFTFTANTSD